MDKDVQTQAVRQMLESARLPGSAVDALLNDATDSDYWRHFCPTLSVGTSRWRDLCEECALDSVEIDQLAQKLGTEATSERKPFCQVR
jgi:hypothetical protein